MTAIDKANAKAIDILLGAKPVLKGIGVAGKDIPGMAKNMILHAGPPIAYAEMCPLHRRSLVSGALFEGLAKDEQDAAAMLERGEIRIDCALNHNTVGAGTGIITSSVEMMVVENRKTGVRAATFPAEGPFQGGLCGWGLYSEEIARNLRTMREELLPPLREMILAGRKTFGGINGC